MANTIAIPGFRGKLDRKGPKWGILTLKELTNRKVNGTWEKGKTFHDITVFEAQMNFMEQHIEEGRFCTVLGELQIDVKGEGSDKRKYTKIIARDIVWAPKAEDKDRPAQNNVTQTPAQSDDDIPF